VDDFSDGCPLRMLVKGRSQEYGLDCETGIFMVVVNILGPQIVEAVGEAGVSSLKSKSRQFVGMRWLSGEASMILSEKRHNSSSILG